MASYFIFPEKDATIYSFYPLMNTGTDEILEISNLQNTVTSNTYEVSRTILKFPQQKIQEVISLVSGSQWSASLNLYLANASEIPLEYSVWGYPLSSSWDMGTGKYLDSPLTTNGVNWVSPISSGSQIWVTSSYAANTTGSYVVGNPGGGVWYTSSYASQSFSYTTEKDINLPVTNIVHSWLSGSIPNEGFLLKLSGSIEFGSTTFGLKYFSRDTHTIYPPALEIKWNDYNFSTGSSTNTLVTNNNIVVTLENNKNTFQQNSIQSFRVNVRPKNPVRTFTTSSVYLSNYYLPLSSSYCLKNLDTEETIIDFDNVFTKISADSTSNYFKIYCDGLQPEKYYKILIKTVIDGETVIHDNNYYFKVVR